MAFVIDIDKNLKLLTRFAFCAGATTFLCGMWHPLHMGSTSPVHLQTRQLASGAQSASLLCAYLQVKAPSYTGPAVYTLLPIKPHIRLYDFLVFLYMFASNATVTPCSWEIQLLTALCCINLLIL